VRSNDIGPVREMLRQQSTYVLEAVEVFIPTTMCRPTLHACRSVASCLDLPKISVTLFVAYLQNKTSFLLNESVDTSTE
jgi:hypothetical protein